MRFVSIVAALALIEYVVILLLTGRARVTYKVDAPATTGHPMFERWYRVQQNTVEQLIVFLPALFLFANYASTRWAGWLGLLFVIGRIVYARSYLADPASRSAGFIIGFSANAILVLGAFLAALF
jgi:glutathione S-transferase